MSDNNNTFSIAIDGPAGAGKSTIARALAKELGAIHLDTGAMYRAAGLFMFREDVVKDPAAVARRVEDVDITLRFLDGEQHIYLSGEDVTQSIRDLRVSVSTMRIAGIPQVREHMLALQCKIAKDQNVVMEGRDIGTRVLPNATLKIYLTASIEERAQRRYKQMKEADFPVKYDHVLKDIMDRDDQDARRAVSPLRPAEDSVHIDSSNMTFDETVALIKRLAMEAIHRNNTP